MRSNRKHILNNENKWHIPPKIAFPILAIVLFAYFFAASAPSPAFVYLQQGWQFSATLLTVAFGVYAIALLLALVVSGSLSDHIGRKPVIFTALIIQAISMLMFFMANNISSLIAARFVQGLATGLVTGALSAAVVEAAPADKKKIGALITSVSPLAGLAVGAIVSGFALKEFNHPIADVFGSLTVIFLIGAVVLLFVPETVSKRAGALASLIPHVSVPNAARKEFWRATPALITIWAMGGLYLSLVPSIILHIFNVNNGLMNGLAIASLTGVGAMAPFMMKRLEMHKTAMLGMCTILVGLILIIFSVSLTSLPLFFFATALSGIGFGGSFSAVVQTLAPKAQLHERAELFAAIFVVSYLSLSIPAMLAGTLVKPLGLSLTFVIYLRILFGVGTIGLFLQLLSLRDTGMKT